MRDDIETFDFDEIIERRGTHAAKWDVLGSRFGLTGDDLIPMWVADMDFRAPAAVNEALMAAAQHGVHGYFGDDAEMKRAVIDWLAARHGWSPEPGWISTAPGIVAAIGLTVQAFTAPGDGVAIFSPVYHMFAKTIQANGRRAVECQLREAQGRYEMDLESLGEMIGPDVKMVLLCSPHNPGGRVWSAEELRALADFCVEHGLILVSDEIHHDLVYQGATHHILAQVAPEIVGNLVTMVAPSKTFNIAGGLTGFVIIENPEMQAKFNAAKAASGIAAINRFGAATATAAYAGGAQWLEALLPYLQANRDLLDRAVAEQMPGVRSMHLEATYLAWLDFSGTGLSPREILDKVNQEARIVVNPGPDFGPGGESWLRFNFACPRPMLETAVGRMIDVFG